MRLIKIIIHKNELTHVAKSVPPWEVPLIDAIHKGAIKQVGETDSFDPLPDAKSEYARLERCYREFRDDNGDYTGETVVGAVYGRFGAGIANLAKAIADSEPEPSVNDLREEATALGVEYDKRWSAAKLREAIAQAREAA
jgi:hypothetical protein